MIAALAALAVGLAILTLSADRLVISAVRITQALGVSAVLIGALVIGLGTSMPELAVSLLSGDVDRAMGNVVGSNVSNLTLVLGLAAFMAPVRARPAALRREGAIMFAALVLLVAFVLGGSVERWEGVVLLVAMVAAYVIILGLGMAKDQDEEIVAEVEAEVDEFSEGGSSPGGEALWALATLALVVASSWLLVWGAKRLAVELDLTNAFVGLIILAIGTSLPELATSVAAARRGEVDLIVGNVLGSNIFNSLLIAGLVGVTYPGMVAPGVEAAAILGMIVAAIAGIFANSERPIAKWEGLALLSGFAALVALAA